MAEIASAGIRLERVSAVFSHPELGDVLAVRDIDLDVQPGELLTLLGPSGCGKTTTLRMIAGFQEPSAGRIFIGERDETNVPANKRDIGLVFQSYALFPHLTVFENVAYGLRVRRKPERELRPAVADVLKLVGLDGFGPRLPSELSGGQQQRVALARAIVIRPRVLLFDEPLSNLDAKLRVEMRTEIQRLHRTLGITTVYVTHDQEEAMALSDRIAVMQGGRIAQLGTAEELYRRPASTFVASFLGRANIMRGIARETTDKRVTLDVIAGVMSFANAGSLTAGAAAAIIVRPEAISIRPPGAGVPAKIVSRVYLGDKVEYVVRVGDQMLQVVRSDPPEGEDAVPGDTVGLVLPQTATHLIEDDGQQ